jgi:hypothetical protein
MYVKKTIALRRMFSRSILGTPSQPDAFSFFCLLIMFLISRKDVYEEESSLKASLYRAEQLCMYVCRLFNNIEFRANPPLYTIVQYIKTSVDSTMLKIRNEKKKYIYKMYDSKKNFFKLIQGLAARPH